MADKAVKHPYLKRSNTAITSKLIAPKPKSNLDSIKTQTHSKNIHTSSNNCLTQGTSNSNTIINQNNDDITQKIFVETTAHFFFPKCDQAIIFNTIDSIPQIEYIKVLSSITNHSNIKFLSRISTNRFCVYSSNKNIVNDIII